MEQIKEMTAQESLKLISETMDSNRKSIVRSSSKYYILWGSLLAVFSLVIYWLWHSSGKPAWNVLWFAMPVFGYLFAWILGKKDVAVPSSFLGNLTGYVWSAFGAFSIVISAIAIFIVPMPITFTIVLLFGVAECITGIILKNWPIIIGGFIVGVGGAVVAMLLHTEAQMLLFTFAGVILAATGLIIKLQNK